MSHFIFVQDKAEGSDTSSVGYTTASWHRCVDKNGWSVVTWSIFSEIFVTFCRYHITFSPGKYFFTILLGEKAMSSNSFSQYPFWLVLYLKDGTRIQTVCIRNCPRSSTYDLKIIYSLLRLRRRIYVLLFRFLFYWASSTHPFDECNIWFNIILVLVIMSNMS